MTDPMTTERLAEISERLTAPRLGRSMAHASDCWTNCTTRYTPKEKP